MNRDEKLKYLCEFFTAKMYDGTPLLNKDLLRDLQVFYCYTILTCAVNSNEGGLEFLKKTKKLIKQRSEKMNFGVQGALQHFIDTWKDDDEREKKDD